MSAFYKDFDDWELSPSDEQTALVYCQQHAISKRRETQEQRRRAFYRYICKRDQYEPMRLGHLDSGEVYMHRPACNWSNGYPSFFAARSNTKDNWYRKRNILFGIAMKKRCEREQQILNAAANFRKARLSLAKKSYRKYFMGVGIDHVPWNILFLADSLIRLKEVMKNKNSTPAKRDSQRSNRGA